MIYTNHWRAGGARPESNLPANIDDNCNHAQKALVVKALKQCYEEIMENYAEATATSTSSKPTRTSARLESILKI